MLASIREAARFTRRNCRTALGLSFALIAGLSAIPAVRLVEAAPAAQLGPLEMTVGTVVSTAGGTFQLERQALSNPSALEQVTIQSPPGVSVETCDIVSISGRYNVAIKILIAESLTKLGSACQKAVSAANLRPTDLDSSLDNENDDDDDDNDNG